MLAESCPSKSEECRACHPVQRTQPFLRHIAPLPRLWPVPVTANGPVGVEISEGSSFHRGLPRRMNEWVPPRTHPRLSRSAGCTSERKLSGIRRKGPSLRKYDGDDGGVTQCRKRRAGRKIVWEEDGSHSAEHLKSKKEKLTAGSGARHRSKEMTDLPVARAEALWTYAWATGREVQYSSYTCP